MTPSTMTMPMLVRVLPKPPRDEVDQSLRRLAVHSRGQEGWRAGEDEDQEPVEGCRSRTKEH